MAGRNFLPHSSLSFPSEKGASVRWDAEAVTLWANDKLKFHYERKTALAKESFVCILDLSCWKCQRPTKNIYGCALFMSPAPPST